MSHCWMPRRSALMASNTPSLDLLVHILCSYSMVNSDNLLSPEALTAIQAGTMAYRYRGIETYKNPFDLAIYSLLLFDLKPRTIIELGSHKGGSALWFADQVTSMGFDCQVHSVDVVAVAEICDPRIRFHLSDDPGSPLPPDLLRGLPHPWLVVEDADHVHDTVLSHLHYFADWMLGGDYFAVEDGILSQMGVADAYDGGPHSAILAFLDEIGERFAVDRTYCDHFGHNMSWNTDGYLRCNAPRDSK